jgi:ferredoxin/flavodoxin
MSNIIFYFTGTGNSLVVARDIAGKIGDTKLVSIADAIKENNIDLLPYERIGFVYPVYFSFMPLIVERFVNQLHFSKTQYIFGVATLGGISEMSLSQLSQSVETQGGFLSAGFTIQMPGNYIVKYGAFPPGIQQRLFRKEKRKITDISSVVQAQETPPIPKGDIISRLFAKKLRKIMAGFGNKARSFHINNQCSGCGTCGRICPVGNIHMENRHPKWNNQCEQCVACIQWCPSQAIEYAGKTAKRRRYRNPEIKISDLISG